MQNSSKSCRNIKELRLFAFNPRLLLYLWKFVLLLHRPACACQKDIFYLQLAVPVRVKHVKVQKQDKFHKIVFSPAFPLEIFCGVAV